MADPQHLEWLNEGVEAWNERRRKKPFEPDFLGADLRGADLLEADLRRANLRGANLLEADLQGADLQGADLLEADLRRANLLEADLRGANLLEANLLEADLRRADCRTYVYLAAATNDEFAAENTNLTAVIALEQHQLDGMLGDSGTIIPDDLTRPAHWPVLDMHKKKEVKPESPVRYTPTAEFETQTSDDAIQHFPQAPVARNASATPINEDQKADLGAGLQELVGTLCKALRKYKKEEEAQSNRVKAAQQMLIPAEALQKTLGAERFLPTLLEDYIESLAGAGVEAVDGFEDTDKKLYERVIKRGRQLYSYYPEIEEVADPANARFITDEFPFTLEGFTAEINEIVYSDVGLEFFNDQTRELIEAELKATVPRGQDEEKTKLARLGGMVGEMKREMSVFANKVPGAIDKADEWIATYQKVKEIWDLIEPFIGLIT